MHTTRSPLYRDLVTTGNLQPPRARHRGYRQSTNLSASGEVLPKARRHRLSVGLRGWEQPSGRDGIPVRGDSYGINYAKPGM